MLFVFFQNVSSLQVRWCRSSQDWPVRSKWRCLIMSLEIQAVWLAPPSNLREQTLHSFQFPTVVPCGLILNFLKYFCLLWFGKLTSQNRYSTDLCLSSTAAGMGDQRRPLKLGCCPPSIPGVYISLYASNFCL